MKFRSALLIVLASLVAISCLSVALAWAQFGGEPDKSRAGMALINDLQSRQAPGPDIGRFQIIKLTENLLLLDSRTGDTWVLTADEQQHGKLSWVPIPRLREGEGDARLPEGKAQSEKDFDPFK